MNDQFPQFIRQFPLAMMPPGVEGNSNFLDAPQGQVVFHTIPQGQQIPLHSHKASFAVLVSGNLAITVGDESFIAEKGTSWYIPSDAMHGGSALTDSLLVEVFCEQRFFEK